MKGLEILLFFMVTDDNFLPCPTLHSIAILILLPLIRLIPLPAVHLKAARLISSPRLSLP